MAEPGPKRARRAAPPLSLAQIRGANPELEDEQGARAYLLPRNREKSLIRMRVDAPAAPTRRGHGSESRTVSPRDLQLYTLDSSAEMLAVALFAGFFPFASEFAFPGRRLEERGLLNLELGGPEVDVREGDPGGRLVLELSPASSDRLIIGKRSLKSCGGGGGGGRSRIGLPPPRSIGVGGHRVEARRRLVRLRGRACRLPPAPCTDTRRAAAAAAAAAAGCACRARGGEPAVPRGERRAVGCEQWRAGLGGGGCDRRPVLRLRLALL